MGRVKEFFSGLSMIGRGAVRSMSRRRLPRRNYTAAVQNDLTADWKLDEIFSDDVLKSALPIMRKRSRHLFKNNDYAKQFGRVMQYGVIGPNGIKMQSRVKNDSGELDKPANDKIEFAWKNWGKKKQNTVDRKKTIIDLQNILILSLVRDGELLFKKVKGFDNNQSFALQMLDVSRLDEQFNQDLQNGNKIRMSIEFNPENAPVAYHLLTNINNRFGNRGDAYQRVPADEIVHEFLQEDPEQIRGVPFLHTAILRLRMVGGMEEATLVASRIGASSMGFFTSEEGSSYAGDGTDEDGNIVREATPGGFEVLPKGIGFTAFDPKQPNAEFSPFLKAVLRGAASGMGVSYNTLANDLEGVNYSSLKKGDQLEKDFFRGMQKWFSDHVLTDIFDDWLPMVFLTGDVDLPITKIKKFNAPVWQGRGWQGLEPLKDSTANINNIGSGLSSRTNILAAQGLDYEELIEQLKNEQEIAASAGVAIQKVDTATAQKQIEFDELNGDENETDKSTN